MSNSDKNKQDKKVPNAQCLRDMSLRITIKCQNHLKGNLSKYYFPIASISSSRVVCSWSLVFVVLRTMEKNLYLCYNVSHSKYKFSHEFLEFGSSPNRRRANNSNDKHGVMIRKQAHVHKSEMKELKRIIDDSKIPKKSWCMTSWPSRLYIVAPTWPICLARFFHSIKTLTLTSINHQSND